MQLYNLLRLQLALIFVIALVAGSACETRYEELTLNQGPAVPQSPKIKPLPDNATPQLKQMLEGAIAQAGVTTGYDPAYVALDYPNGDVPEKTGVCSDVVVRAFRKAGIDLRKEADEDRKATRNGDPTRWGANAPNKTIDHRRVLNLMRCIERRGKSLPLSNAAADYQPRDAVAWELRNGSDHIGIVTNMPS